MFPATVYSYCTTLIAEPNSRGVATGGGYIGIYTHPKSVYVKNYVVVLNVILQCSEILIVAADRCQVMFDEQEHLILNSFSCQTVYAHFWYTVATEYSLRVYYSM